MLPDVAMPRLRTIAILGCVVLICTFYWDIILLRSIYGIQNSSVSHNFKHRKVAPTNWSWECATAEDNSRYCRRAPASPSSLLTLSTCIMSCQPGLNLWPYPTGNVKIKNTSSPFQWDHVKVDFTPVNSLDLSLLLTKTTKDFQQRISKLAQSYHHRKTDTKLTVSVHVTATSKDIKYRLNVDESYKLVVAMKGPFVRVTIKASTFLGARHGLETLMQLMWWDERRHTLIVLNNVEITDSPFFPYRGLMLDTAKNYLPVSSILRTLDAMSMNKMNVFHWHLTDSQSFPYASKLFPKFSESGAYSGREVYTPDDIKEVARHAETRGISVLIEVDSPAHTSQGWNWGEEKGLGNLTLNLNAQEFSEYCTEPPCGQLNPVNNNTYSVLVKLLKELYGMTKTVDLIHIGGDDVDLTYWEAFEDVTNMDVYLKKGVIGVWEFFYKSLQYHLAREKMLSKNIVVWSNALIDNTDFWRNLKPIVQSRGSRFTGELEKLVSQKMRVIVSSSDVWTLGEPQPWSRAYLHRPWTDLSVLERRLVIGGEALAWTHQLDQHSLEPSLWPMAAAVAERLWSDPASKSVPTDRLARATHRLNLEGIRSSAVCPKWCVQNPTQCV